MPVVLAPLAAIAIAIVAILLIYAFYQLFSPLLQGLGQAGGTVGGFIFRLAEHILTLGYQAAMGWAKSALHAVLGFVLSPVFWIERHIAELINTLGSLTAAVHWIESYYVPNALNSLAGTVRGWVTGAETYAASLVSSLASWARAQFAALYQYVAAGLAQDAAYSLSLFDAAEKYIQASITAETAYVQGALSALETYTAAGLAQDAAYAEHLAAAGLAYTQQAVNSAVIAIDTDLTNITSWVTQETGALAASIALAQTQAFAYARSLTAVVEADLGKLKSDCTDNLCSGLGDLATLFNALTGDLGLAALFGLAAEMAHDPKGTATVVESTLGPVARDAAGAVRSLIGL